MSRTNKHILKAKTRTAEDFEELPLEIQFSYPETGGKKFKAELGRGTGISSLGKLVARNANRSVIKAKRQKAKKEIEQVLSEDDNLDIEREVFL